jgi:hypothetical protein
MYRSITKFFRVVSKDIEMDVFLCQWTKSKFMTYRVDIVVDEMVDEQCDIDLLW